MALTNLTGTIFGLAKDNMIEKTPESDTDDVDECSLDSNLCGMEAGCLNTVGSYLCICHDLRPVGENHSCEEDRKFPGMNNNLPDPTNEWKGSTEAVFQSPQFHGMLSKANIGIRNDTEADSTSAPNVSSMPSISSLQTSADFESDYTILVTCLFSISLVVVVSFAVYIWYRGRKGWPLMPICLGRRRGRSVSQYALEKCLQRYVTNPNYYSHSPDAAFVSAMSNMELPQENVTLLEEVGEGCFGKVHKGLYTDNRGTTIPVAIKLLKDGATAEIRSDFEREVEIMSSFQHENILTLLGVVILEHRATPWMVFEFMHFGDLAELLRSNNPGCRIGRDRPFIKLTEVDMIFITIQIASGMVYLSSQHFVHRDLATRNCLVDDKLNVKISDFGMSRDIYTSDYYKLTGSRMLPIRWMAPESITYGKFSLESDVWAYGVVLWEIFTFGKQPYYGHSNDEIVKLILQGILLSPPENCPLYVCSIMAGCWKTEPRHRFTFSEIHNILIQNTTAARLSSPTTDAKSIADDLQVVIDETPIAVASTSV